MPNVEEDWVKRIKKDLEKDLERDIKKYVRETRETRRFTAPVEESFVCIKPNQI